MIPDMQPVQAVEHSQRGSTLAELTEVIQPWETFVHVELSIRLLCSCNLIHCQSLLLGYKLLAMSGGLPYENTPPRESRPSLLWPASRRCWTERSTTG